MEKLIRASAAIDEDVTFRRLLTASVISAADILSARQRARQLARLLGFGQHDQIQIAAATSEIVRNAVQYAQGGRIEFSLREESMRFLFVVSVSDSGPGIGEPERLVDGQSGSKSGSSGGMVGTKRLMDRFLVVSSPGKGATVTFGKLLPADTPRLDAVQIARIGEQLARETPENASEQLLQQNRELLLAFETLQRRESELRQRQAESERLNLELEETNRGVVALYAELDERASALSGANEVKTRFLSHMSHEFRTPLNSILALTELLIRRADGDLSEEQEKQVLFVRSAARELFDMVNDLLDIAKVESGQVELRFGPVAVSKLFSALRGMMRPLINPDAASLVFDDAPEELVINTDEGKLSQILRNLVSNAIKFTEKGEIRISVGAEQNHVNFFVADTGIGIAVQDQEKIFHEFAQIDGPVQRKVKGTGLGLPLSRSLAELLDGSLTVESHLGSGSVFRLRIPLREEEVCMASEAGESQNSVGQLAEASSFEKATAESYQASILVIDDEETNRYLARKLFRGTGYSIIEAASGLEGLERARAEHPKMILLDLTMPGLSGFEVLDDLKSDPATCSIPVVIHTSRSLGPEEMSRLGGRQSAVLPKQLGGTGAALNLVRELLGEERRITGLEDRA